MEEKKAKKVYTLEEIRFNEANKTNSILACLPVIGFILLLTEKDDLFVRYMGAQYTIVYIVEAILAAIIPYWGWGLSSLVGTVVLVLIIVGIVKTSQGERFDIPLVSEWALKLMAAI